VFELAAAAVVLESFAGDEPVCVGIQIWISEPKAPDPFGSGAAGSNLTSMPALVASTCVEVEPAPAVCEVGASCVTDCDWPP
jgi:hypothetical protein